MSADNDAFDFDEPKKPAPKRKKQRYRWVTWDEFVIRFALFIIIVLLFVIATRRG